MFDSDTGVMGADLPITPLLPQIIEHLQQHPRLVLEAPPGAGKTTQVPLSLLDADWLDGQRIIMLEPRRIAARAAAGFMARQRGEVVGASVGYHIRFESRVSAATRIEVVTEGIFTRMIQADPTLDGVGAVIFDEFHERHLGSDLGLALSLDVQAQLRPDLRLLLMSATLDGARVAEWLHAPRLSSPGRSYPVHIEHPAPRAQETMFAHLARIMPQVLAKHTGDVLVFLPGKREIERARRSLAARSASASVELVPLHGDLSLAGQRAALAPAGPGSRRIVLATNVAESSVTLPGIRVVIDSGLAREPRFDPRSGLTRLETVAISRASADQRAGRAGRVAAGTVFRLWPASKRLQPARTPEMAQAELSTLALELAAWGQGELQWLDPPPHGAIANARDLLRRLGALDQDARITALGRSMLALGAHPRMAAACERAPVNQRALLPDLLALIESRSPLRGEQARSDDFRQRLAALHAWRDSRLRGTHGGAADTAALAAIEQLAQHWRKRLRVRTRASGTSDAHTVGNILLHAFPDRVAMRDANDPMRYQLASGRGARLDEHSELRGAPWLVALDLRLETRDSLILSAAPFDASKLHDDYPEHFCKRRVQQWNPARDAVEAFEEQCFDAIVVNRQRVTLRPEDADAAMLAAVRERGLDLLPWNASSRQLRVRIECLREWCPEIEFPDVSEPVLLADLDTWLLPWLTGKTRLTAFGADDLAHALGDMLNHAQRQRLREYAPTHMRVPSGREHAITYAPGAAPVLAVKLQELFGLAESPRIAKGRIPLTLHLLSPAGRPIQVTRDLGNFWAHTYIEVKKELKGRYPKHPWPDDPWAATATAHAKRRGR